MKYSTLSIIYIVIAIIILCFGVAIGSSEIFYTFPTNPADRLIFNLRLFRLLGAFVTGASLACSGLIFQAILRNPLAEPFTLGLSSGSAVGAALAFITGAAIISSSFTNLFAFLGAIIVLMLVLLISKNANTSSESLLLSGVITGTVMSGILMYLISMFPNADKLAGITWWMLGDLQSPDPFILSLNWILLIISGITIQFFAQDIDAMSIGSLEAYDLGVNHKKVLLILTFIASLLAAGTVALAGIIGFCGLAVPHIVKLLHGNTHRRLVIPVIASGGIFLMLCDTLSRSFSVREIPIGVITSLIGGPLFLWLLNCKKHRL